MTTTAPGLAPRPAPAATVPLPYRVVRTRQDTRDTVTLWLRAVQGETLRFVPGQFTMLHAFGVGEVPISISGDPDDPTSLQHTIRDVGSVSHALAAADPGTMVGVRGPYGTGWDVEAGRGGDVVLVAGGIGLAPLRPAILEVCAHRTDYRRVVLRYGARTPAEILFADDLARWGERHSIDVQVTVDHGSDGWQGRVGLVTRLLDDAVTDPVRTLALTCGPEVMMRLSAVALVDRGVPAGQVRLSMERNMKCGVGLCGHCQLREFFLCVDGPVLAFDRLRPLMARDEL